MNSELYQSVQAASDRVMDILCGYAESGYVKTLAHILCYVGKDSERAQKVLAGYPEDLQQKVQAALDELDSNANQDEVLDDASIVLNQSDFNQQDQIRSIIETKDAVGGPGLLPVIDSFMTKNPLLALAISEYAAAFDDLKYIDDRAIQKVLREVDTALLAKALKTADEETSNKVFRNMSNRAATMLKEDIEFMGPIRVSDSLEAQQKIAEIMMQLSLDGEIIIPVSGESLVV